MFLLLGDKDRDVQDIINEDAEADVSTVLYRFFWTTVDTSRKMIPAPVMPMTTPNTMSHGGVSYETAAARVGTMSMNSRVESVSRKALLMRFLDFLLEELEFREKHRQAKVFVRSQVELRGWFISVASEL